MSGVSSKRLSRWNFQNGPAINMKMYHQIKNSIELKSYKTKTKRVATESMEIMKKKIRFIGTTESELDTNALSCSARKKGNEN